MKHLLVLTLGAALTVSACGTAASDATDAPLESGNSAAAGTADAPDQRRAPARAARPAAPTYREMTIPSGTSLPLSLTSSIGSDTSAVEDAVTARLTRGVMVDGREAIPAGAEVQGFVTQVDDSGRVKGRAMIAFRFNSLNSGGTQYDLETATLTHLAPATKGEDAAKIGIGAGAGAIIGGILGGGDGAAKGAAIGGGAGTGVVLATKGKEMRLGPGADVTSQLTAPLTIRVRFN